MNKYAASLRGINVGGRNKLNMAELKRCLSTAGFENPVTYLNSGNVIMESSGNAVDIEEKISRVIQDNFSLEVQTIVRSTEEIVSILESEPFKEFENNYVILLKHESFTDISADSDRVKLPDDRLFFSKKNIYLFVPGGAGRSKLTNAFFEKKLVVAATTRNIKTLRKVLSIISQR